MLAIYRSMAEREGLATPVGLAEAYSTRTYDTGILPKATECNRFQRYAIVQSSDGSAFHHATAVKKFTSDCDSPLEKCPSERHVLFDDLLITMLI